MSRFSKQTFKLSPKRRALLELLLQEDGVNSSSKQIISKRKSSDPSPLSFAQQRLWYLEQLGTGSAYNISMAVRLKGLLNVTALEESLNEIVRRHKALRTTFAMVEGNPVQVIDPEFKFSLPKTDLCKSSKADHETEVLQLAVEEVRRLFDLVRGPLFRASLLRLSGQDNVLLLTMHHIVSDGWSMGIFTCELSALYQSFCNGGSTLLPELPIQYADFAVWQRQWLQGDVLETQLSYWRQQLKGISTLQLPTDRPRPEVQTFRGGCQSLALTQPLIEALNTLSRREGVTLFMTLLAVFNVMLYRYSGQDDIVVGSPIANRNRAEIEGLIGFFVNSLIMRTDLSGNPNFLELLGRVREVALGAYAHQDLPFEKLVEDLRPKRDLSRTPLFQIVFALQNAPMDGLKLSGLTVTSIKMDNIPALFDLTLHLRERPDGLSGVLIYNTDLFDAVTITRMLEHYKTLLEGITANPEQRISDLPLLTEAEHHKLLIEWNNTRTDYPMEQCVHELFEEHAKRNPDSIAVVFNDRKLTYSELNARANQLAHYLKKRGIGPEVFVGICMERSLEMVLGLLAILKAGGAYVPLDPTYPKERLAFMLADTRVQVLLTQKRLLDGLPEYDGGVVCLDSGWNIISEESEENPVSGVMSGNPVYVIYTSGSTGKPKGVLIPHQRLLNLIYWYRHTFEVTASDQATQLASLAFDASAFELWPILTAGATLHLAPPEIMALPEQLRDWLVSKAITISFVPTPLAEYLLSLDWPEKLALRILHIGGDKLHHTPPVSLPFKIVDNYGPAENTVVTTSGTVLPSCQFNITPSIGKPVFNTQVYLLDEHLALVPIGAAGELCISGEGLARGYLNRPELTAEKFIPNPFSNVQGMRLYKTGDIARYLPDGKIEFLNRIDYQVKIRGFRIELGEIETALQQHPAVRETVVLAREDVPGDKRLAAYVVSTQEPAPGISELRSFLKKKLPGYMVPSIFVLLDTLPLTPNGKVDRRALPVPDGVHPETEEGFTAPRTPLEKAMASIWIEMLDISQVGIHDNFFDLGGHSLLLMQVINRLEKRVGLRIKPREFMFQNLEQIASAFEEEKYIHEQSKPARKNISLRGIEPFYFGTSGKQLFGCYHALPSGSNRCCGVVLCYPIGEEYIRFHRTFRLLDKHLSKFGFHVLRFDFHGCGDSAGECEQGRIDQWIADISTAINEIRRRSGMMKICLIGLRLGGTLAMMAGAERSDIDAMVLLDPVVSGKGYIKELNDWHNKMLRYSHVNAKLSAKGENFAEILGFPITDFMRADIRNIDLLSIRQKPADSMLVIESHEENRNERLAEYLESMDISVEYQHLPYPQLWARSDRFMLEDVSKVLVPDQILRSAASWVSERFS